MLAIRTVPRLVKAWYVVQLGQLYCRSGVISRLTFKIIEHVYDGYLQPGMPTGTRAYNDCLLDDGVVLETGSRLDWQGQPFCSGYLLIRATAIRPSPH
jgi:hypothetical protein